MYCDFQRENTNIEENQDEMAHSVYPETDSNRVWKFWCHNCEELLDRDPKILVDHSLECVICNLNLVERIAQDDYFLIKKVEAKKEMERFQWVHLPEYRESSVTGTPTTELEVPNVTRSPFQYNIILHNNIRSGQQQYQNQSEQPTSRSSHDGPSNSQQWRRSGIAPSEVLVEMDLRTENSDTGAQMNDNFLARVFNQLDRILEGDFDAPSDSETEWNIDVIIQDVPNTQGGGSFGGDRLDSSDFGDGFNGLVDILNMLETQGDYSGPPPASKKVVEKLKELEWTCDLEESEDTACAVCKEDFKLRDKFVKFPCPNKHPYHRECIHPWLKLHNNCPVCRHEVITDDEWYERMKQMRTSTGPVSNANPSSIENPSEPGASGIVG